MNKGVFENTFHRKLFFIRRKFIQLPIRVLWDFSLGHKSHDWIMGFKNASTYTFVCTVTKFTQPICQVWDVTFNMNSVMNYIDHIESVRCWLCTSFACLSLFFFSACSSKFYTFQQPLLFQKKMKNSQIKIHDVIIYLYKM